MSDVPVNPDWTADAETTSIPIRGDCGHNFPVPLARLQDGVPFDCPVCGQSDRVDEAALLAARDQLAALADTCGSDSLAALIRQILARIEPDAKLH